MSLSDYVNVRGLFAVMTLL